MNCELVKREFKNKDGNKFYKLYLVFDDGPIQIEGHKGEFVNVNKENIKFNTARTLIAKAKLLKD